MFIGVIKFFSRRGFNWGRKHAKRTVTPVDDNTLNLLEPTWEQFLNGELSATEAGMKFTQEELQMFVDYAKKHRENEKLWAFLRAVQQIFAGLDLS